MKLIKRSYAPKTLKHQAGFTLIEMMISLVLGLIIIAAVINMYMGSSRSAQFTSGLQTMQENGRYGVTVMQRGLRLAGYAPERRLDPIDVELSGADSITVVMRRNYDCNGSDTEKSSSPGFAVNTYALDAKAQQITCKGNGPDATAMPIVEGVEGFRILYGLDTDDDEVPDRYVSYNSSIPPRQIVGVRFAMLVNSGVPIRSRQSKEEHVLLDTIIKRNDRFARHVFGSTVLLRNRL